METGEGGGEVAKPSPARAEPSPAQADRQSGKATTAADRKMSVAGSSNPEQEKEFLERLLAGSALRARHCGLGLKGLGLG